MVVSNQSLVKAQLEIIFNCPSKTHTIEWEMVDDFFSRVLNPCHRCAVCCYGSMAGTTGAITFLFVIGPLKWSSART